MRAPRSLALVVALTLAPPLALAGEQPSTGLPAELPPPKPAAPVVDDEPAPLLHSFHTADSFDGKVGLGALYARTEPFGTSTGYGQLFWQGDYDGILGTGFSVHWDFDLRVSMFEQTDRTYLNARNERITVDEDGNWGPVGQCDNGAVYNPRLVDPCVEQGDYNHPLEHAELTRQPFNFYTGRTIDYLRIDKLYASYDSELFGASLGRMMIAPAASTFVDGADVHVGFGRLGSGGFFLGLRPNPWHQQVVGAASGGGVYDGAGAFFAPLWGGIGLDEDFAYSRGGPYSNEIGVPHEPGDLALPWTHVASARFLTTGLYSSLRTEPFSADGALVLDTFDLILPDDEELSGIDRIWAHTQGGWRIFHQLTLAFRGTLDVIGARPLVPRDVFLDLRWRNLGPVSVGAKYYKVNTYATALSYAYYFRALEDPDGVVATQNPAENPWLLAGYPEDAAAAAALATTRLNNARLYVVDRDRISADAAVSLSGTLDVYGELIGERRGDTLYVPKQDPLDAFGGIGDSVAALFTGLCWFDPDDENKAVGINPDASVHDDLCRFGGSVGLRDPFLADVGNFDLRFTYLDGYFQSTRRLSFRVGAALRDTLWLEAGAALEDNHNHRVFTNFHPPANKGTAMYTARALNAYVLDASLSWRIWAGLFVEASYFGFVEDVPFQGDSDIYAGNRNVAIRRDQTQVTSFFFARTLYRF